MGSRKQGRCGGTCSRSWAATRIVLAPDLPGLGSSELRGPYDARTVAARIAALALHELDAPVDIMGHDWGGVVGLTLAASRPDLVRRLVVLNAAYRYVDLRAAWHIPTASLPGLPELAFGRWRSLVAQGDSRRVARRPPGRARSPGALPGRLRRPATYRRNARLLPRQLPSPSRGGSSRGGRARPIRAVDRRCRGPGDDRPDRGCHRSSSGVRSIRCCPRACASVVRDLGDCQCVVIPHAGHFVLEEAPETAIPAIAAFSENRTAWWSRTAR